MTKNPLEFPGAIPPKKETALNAAYFFPLSPRTIEVTSVRKVSDTMMRVSFTGETLQTIATVSPEDHVKLFFGTDPHGEPVIPVVVDDRWSGGRDLTYRDYTIRTYDVAANTLEIDFVLHDHGVAGVWAASAKPGMQLGMLGPRGAFLTKDIFDTYVLAADETALPALSRWLEYVRPDARIHAFIEVSGPASEQSLPAHAGASVTYLHRPDPAQPSRIAPTLAALNWASFGTTYAWVAGEAGDIKPCRSLFKTTLDMHRDTYNVDGYWKRGAVNHDHHADED